MEAVKVSIRRARPEDVPQVNSIHKHYVEKTVITFVTEANTDEAALANYEKTNEQGLPYLVATDADNQTVLGYCYVSQFRGVKPGYRHTLELSLFCHPDHTRKGAGSQLLTTMIDILKRPEDWRSIFEGTRLIDDKPQQLIAVMAIDIEGPGNGLKLRDWYQRFDFSGSGHLKEGGWKKDRWVDTIYLQLALSD